MGIHYECDGCGMMTESITGGKPHLWLERDIFLPDNIGNLTQHRRLVVCSPKCVKEASKIWGIDDLIIPNDGEKK